MAKTLTEITQLDVLVIEDNLGDYFLLEEYLKESFENIFINHCANFNTAIDFIKNNRNKISVIFSDLHLPDSSDIELVQNLLLHADSTPIILLSGHKNEKIVQESKKLGVSNLLMKDDLNPNILKETIEFVV
ncbi:response regulator [Polaribacter sp. BAL334]|uniref:response regulator n=1 Tax=Polaribacter sp. BAL334 TaxID=1708178 RepID=UPI0018D266C6|nr:response regulator [Polaribacter sp. BAL334]MBG7613199.1 response regulator [Polaribacter sp. BAL334]